MWVFCELGDNKAAPPPPPPECRCCEWEDRATLPHSYPKAALIVVTYSHIWRRSSTLFFPFEVYHSGYVLIEQLIVMEIWEVSLWFRLCLAASTDWLKYTLMLALKLICGFTKKNIVTEPPVISHPALVSKGSEVIKSTLVFGLIPAVFIYSKKHFICNHWHQYRWWKPSLKGHYGPANVESIKSCMIIRWLSMAHLHTLCHSWAGEHYFSFP